VTIVGSFFFVQKLSDGVNHLATLQQSTIPQVDGQLPTTFFPAGVGHVSFLIQQRSGFERNIYRLAARNDDSFSWCPRTPGWQDYETQLMPIQNAVWGSTDHAGIHAGVWNTPFRQHILSWVVISHNPSYQQSTFHVRAKRTMCPLHYYTRTHRATSEQQKISCAIGY